MKHTILDDGVSYRDSSWYNFNNHQNCVYGVPRSQATFKSLFLNFLLPDLSII